MPDTAVMVFDRQQVLGGETAVDGLASNAELHYRPEVDGLRAVAVLSVLLFHAFPSLLPGGFVGVDVFFVISGYLITSLLLKKMEAARLDLLEFWERRIRRIFPALAVMTLATLVVGWFLLLPADYKEVGESVSAQMLFLSNIFFWRHTSYFDSAADIKPLLHTWSLAVEEQFYAVWPWLYRQLHKKGLLILCLALILCCPVLRGITISLSRADIFSKILVAKVEPQMGNGRPAVLIEYPRCEAALARASARDPRVAERFELYACGVELANAFGELADPVEQRRRLAAEMAGILESRVYVGVSAGSMIFSRNLSERTGEAFGEQDDLQILGETAARSPFGLFDWYLKPHLNSPSFPNRTHRWFEKAAAQLDFPVYAIDDDSAVRVRGDEVDVVSDGEWRLLNAPAPETAGPDDHKAARPGRSRRLPTFRPPRWLR